MTVSTMIRYNDISYLQGVLAPKASYTTNMYSIVNVQKKQTHNVETVQQMIAQLRDSHLPISAIAEMAQVERKTIYAWLDGGNVQTSNQERISTIFNVLKPVLPHSKSLYRIWNRKLINLDNASLKELLSAQTISTKAISNALQELNSAIKYHAEREEVRAMSNKSGRNGALEEMPIASFNN
jgi:hypothetical protein